MSVSVLNSSMFFNVRKVCVFYTAPPFHFKNKVALGRGRKWGFALGLGFTRSLYLETK